MQSDSNSENSNSYSQRAKDNKVGPQVQSLRVRLLCPANSSPRLWCLPEAPSAPDVLGSSKKPPLIHHPPPFHMCLQVGEKRGSEVVGNVAGFQHTAQHSVPVHADSSFLQASGTLPESFAWSLEQVWLMSRADGGLNALRSNCQTMIDWN